MNYSLFIICAAIYFLITTAYSLVIYFVAKNIERSSDPTISSTSKLYNYRQLTSIWIPSIIFWVMIFTLYENNLGMLYYIIFSLAVVGFFVYYLTIFRKNTIKLTNDIKKINPIVGSAVQFNSGFSSNTGSEMIKLFIILVISIGFIVGLALLLIKLKWI